MRSLGPRIVGTLAIALASEPGCRREPGPAGGGSGPGAETTRRDTMHEGRRSSRSHAPRRVEETAPGSADVAGAWASRTTCQALVRAGRRVPRDAGDARIATWNVRWFPDGIPGRRGELGTDLAWLACAITFTDAAVVAVQEFKADPEARAAAATLLRELDALSGGSWALALDGCPAGGRQHVGLLHDTRRATASAPRAVAELNPEGAACAASLRPGFGARFAFPGGLDLEVISVHLDSGRDGRAARHRARALAAVEQVASAARAAGDPDLLVLGDFNTMGCGECDVKTDGPEEIRAFRDEATRRGLRWLGPSPPCTWLGKKPSVLDHFVVAGLPQVTTSTVPHVGGACAAGCGDPDLEASVSSLSDHCPSWIDVRDVDRD